MNEKELIDYCMAYYGPGADLYEDFFPNTDGTNGITVAEISNAYQTLTGIKHKFCFGTPDRELVRDIILYHRGSELLDLEYGTFIETKILGLSKTRARVKESWIKEYQSMGITIDKEFLEHCENRLNELGILK
jgi:hypothetical protein